MTRSRAKALRLELTATADAINSASRRLQREGEAARQREALLSGHLAAAQQQAADGALQVARLEARIQVWYLLVASDISIVPYMRRHCTLSLIFCYHFSCKACQIDVESPGAE